MTIDRCHYCRTPINPAQDSIIRDHAKNMERWICASCGDKEEELAWDYKQTKEMMRQFTYRKERHEMVLKPANNKKYEAGMKTAWTVLPTTEFLNATIIDIHRNPTRTRVQNGETKIYDAIRFKFEVENVPEPRYSFWELFSYSERANLYRNFLAHLVENAEPFMDFDLERLKGMKVRIMFSEPWGETGLQKIQLIKPQTTKISR